MIANIASNVVKRVIPHVFDLETWKLIVINDVTCGYLASERCVKPQLVVPHSVLG